MFKYCLNTKNLTYLFSPMLQKMIRNICFDFRSISSENINEKYFYLYLFTCLYFKMFITEKIKSFMKEI